MISMFINGNSVPVELEGEKKVGDVLKAFEINCEQNNAAVIGILVDDNYVTADNFDEVSEQDLGENTKFEFSVVTVESIKESFAYLSNLFSQLSEQMEKVPLALQIGQNAEVSESIKKLADSIDQFCHIAALASLFPEDFKNTTIDDMPFNQFFADFQPVLSDFEQALQNNDSVLIGDLSEYEICPRLKAISTALTKM